MTGSNIPQISMGMVVSLSRLVCRASSHSGTIDGGDARVAVPRSRLTNASMQGALMRVGRVVELWRYPVKSMGGERLERGRVVPVHGLQGDRAWAIRDETVGEIRGAKKLHRLLLFDAHYLEDPTTDRVAPVEITFPDGGSLRSADASIDARLSEALSRPVSLQVLRSADDLDHYRRREPIGDESELRSQLGLLPDEPLPDMTNWSDELSEFTSPPGTYFDSFELHLLTTASLDTLARHAPGVEIDARRFRPNLVIDTAGTGGLPEIEWCGGELEVGNARLEVMMPMVRCVMTTCAQRALAKAPEIMRSLVRETQQDLGVGGRVLEAGEIRIGDEVRLRQEGA
jgi:uncharacterized protein YcbX